MSVGLNFNIPTRPGTDYRCGAETSGTRVLGLQTLEHEVGSDQVSTSTGVGLTLGCPD